MKAVNHSSARVSVTDAQTATPVTAPSAPVTSLRQRFSPRRPTGQPNAAQSAAQRRGDWWAGRFSPEARAVLSVHGGRSPNIVRYPAPMTSRILEFLTTREVMGTLPLVSRRHNDAARALPARFQAKLLLDRQAARARQFDQPHSKTSTWLTPHLANSALESQCVEFLRSHDAHPAAPESRTLDMLQQLIDNRHATSNHAFVRELLVAEQDLVETADRVAIEPGLALKLHKLIWRLKAEEVGARVDVMDALKQLRSRLVTVALSAMAGPGPHACEPSLQPEGRVIFVNEPPREDWTPDTVSTCSLTQPITGEMLTAESPWPTPQQGLTFHTVTFDNGDHAGGERCCVFAFNRQSVMDTPD